MKYSSIFSSFILFMNSFSFAQPNIWESVGDPLEGNTFTVLAIDTDDNLYAGTYFDFFKSTNNGDEWTSIYNGYYATSIVFNGQSEMFIGTAGGGGIFKSLDKGETWIHLNDSLINFSISDLDINSNGHLFAAIGGRGMYRSTDNGESWEETVDGLTYYGFNELYIPRTGPIKDFLFVSVNELSSYSYIYRSSDYGNSWEQMNISNGSRWAYAFVSTSDGTIYSGLWETAPHSSNGSVIESENFGYDWSWAGVSKNVTELILDFNENIYAGTDGIGSQGILRKLKDSKNWDLFNSGLGWYSSFQLAVNSNGILFASSEAGIYRTIESTTAINENEEVIPSEFALYQNYPNPFNPSTKIQYQIPKGGIVTIKVYNLLGSEVATLVDEEKVAGNYEVTFDSSELTSGVYFYSLQSGVFIDTKKMILIK